MRKGVIYAPLIASQFCAIYTAVGMPAAADESTPKERNRRPEPPLPA